MEIFTVTAAKLSFKNATMEKKRCKLMLLKQQYCLADLKIQLRFTSAEVCMEEMTEFRSKTSS